MKEIKPCEVANVIDWLYDRMFALGVDYKTIAAETMEKLKPLGVDESCFPAGSDMICDAKEAGWSAG